jgi:hypothetical protein
MAHHCRQLIYHIFAPLSITKAKKKEKKRSRENKSLKKFKKTRFCGIVIFQNQKKQKHIYPQEVKYAASPGIHQDRKEKREKTCNHRSHHGKTNFFF